MVEVCVGLETNLHLNVRRVMLGIVTAAREPAAPGTRVIWTACSGEQTYNWGPHGGAFQLTCIVDTFRGYWLLLAT